jgi:hypothetical protein
MVTSSRSTWRPLPAGYYSVTLYPPHFAGLRHHPGPHPPIPGTDELLREITVRYLPPGKVPAYLAFAAELGEHVAIYMRPQRWLSADLGPS